MKKLLLALPIAAALTACGSVESEIEELASDYCTAIKATDWQDAEPLAKSHVVSNRESMFEMNRQKYMQVFMNQNCGVSKIMGEDGAYTVFFGGSELDFVNIEFNKKEEKYFITSDAFKNDLKLY